MVPLELAALVINERSNEQWVRLRQPDDGRTLALGIGICEAVAIDHALGKRPFPRPLTHDLLLAAIEALGGRLEQVLIDALEGEVFHAKLILSSPAGAQALDARPSDALALALARDVPVLCAPEVLDAAAE